MSRPAGADRQKGTGAILGVCLLPARTRCASNKNEIPRMWVCAIRKLKRDRQVNKLVGRRGGARSLKG